MNGSVDALPPGARLGQYRLIEAASQGGFGILYRAWDEKLNRPVAVKECFPASICRRDPQTGVVQPHTEALRANYEAAIDDVFEEARTLAGLHHARVVPVYDVFRSAGSLFYVMPWLEGGSLRDKIAAGQAISPAEAQRWLLELLSALEYLHGVQVIHRDIKPGNIMFDVGGNPVLVDFGSALNRATKVDTTTQGEFSPVYASPEQVSGKGKIGPWTDLYSLAATWYELLSGAPPEPTQQRLVQDDLRPLPLGKTVLEQSIMQNLALSVADRCQSAREWQEWLLRGTAPVAVAHRRRLYWLWGLFAMLLVAGGAFLVKPEPAAPAPVEEQADFYRHVCEQMQLDSMVQELRNALQRRTQVIADCKKQVDAVLQKMIALRDSDMEAWERRKAVAALEREVQSLVKAAAERLDQIDKIGCDYCAKVQNRAYSPEDVYQWSTQDEYVRLLKLKPMLEKDYMPAVHDYQTSQSDHIEVYREGEIMRCRLQCDAN